MNVLSVILSKNMPWLSIFLLDKVNLAILNKVHALFLCWLDYDKSRAFFAN